MAKKSATVACLLLVAAAGLVQGRVPFKNHEEYVIEDIIDQPPIVLPPPVIKQRTSLISNESTSSLARISYAGNQLWKIVIDEQDKLSVLTRLRDEGDIRMWGGNTTAVDIMVKPESLEKVKMALDEEEIKYQVVIEDLQKAIDEENPPVKDFDFRKGHRITWQAYHPLEDHHGYLDFLAQTYPDLCTVQTIGHSIEGRPLKIIKISNGKLGNKAMWIDGGMHAREWISPATVAYLINHLVTNFENEPAYVQGIDWYIAPIMNPDGYEYTHKVDRLWRKNRRTGLICSGVDLNRNFGYRWGGAGVSKFQCSEIYGGTGPFSEPETAAIHRFVTDSSANWKTSISFHSYGQYILFPWGYSKAVPPDYKDIQQVADKAASAIYKESGATYETGPAGSTLYPAAGGSDDWAKGVVKMKYAFTIELRDKGRYGFVLPAAHIVPTAKEALAAVRVIAEATYTA